MIADRYLWRKINNITMGSLSLAFDDYTLMYLLCLVNANALTTVLPAKSDSGVMFCFKVIMT